MSKAIHAIFGEVEISDDLFVGWDLVGEDEIVRFTLTNGRGVDFDRKSALKRICPEEPMLTVGKVSVMSEVDLYDVSNSIKSEQALLLVKLLDSDQADWNFTKSCYEYFKKEMEYYTDEV